MWADPGIYKSLTGTGKWKFGLRRAGPRKGIHERDFPCSVGRTTVRVTSQPMYKIQK
jgi:hypothetical protein